MIFFFANYTLTKKIDPFFKTCLGEQNKNKTILKRKHQNEH